MNKGLDGSEFLLPFVALICTLLAGASWITNVVLAWRLRACGLTRGLLLIIPMPCVGLMAAAIARWADQEVRSNPFYFLLLLGLGAAWLGMVSKFFGWLGVSVRDDAVERNNPAAALAWAGAMLGTTLFYSGANTGAGPSLWNNVFCAALATGALALLWLGLVLSCRISSSIALERDLASGVRGGGFFAAAGLILGRAVAGDWHSTAQTLVDFARDGWPVLPLTAIAFASELLLRPSPQRPSPPVVTHGLLPAALYCALAGVWVAHLGWWEGHR